MNMKTHVQILDKVPDQIFIDAKEEVLKINWDQLPIPDRRGEAEVFRTSITNHLRVHAAPPGTPHTVEALSAYVNCVDTRARWLYPKMNKLINWIHTHVEGKRMGRIMLVRFTSGGKIGEHVDPGPYFDSHYRFHVPFVTHPAVEFFGPGRSNPTHMPEGYLSQLANRDFHSAENNSPIDRIHLIIDIDSKNPRFVI